jgi:hypothetical protein
MWIGQTSKSFVLLAGTGLVLSGCAQTGSTFTLPRRTSMGTLKTSLSHLEYENQQLRREVAQLKTDTRDIEDRLVQEEAENGELKATLNDARHLLSQRGFDFDSQPSSTTGRNPNDDEKGTTIPAGQSTRKRRKAPFTQIPGRIEAIPRAEPADDDEHVIAPGSGHGDPFGPQSQLNDADRWLPIAHGTTASDRQKKVR